MKQKNFSKWIFAGAALLLGLTACNNKKEDDLSREKGYDTYTTIALSLPSSLRAGDDDYNKQGTPYTGVDHIKTLTLYIIDDAKPAEKPEVHHFTEDNLHLDGATGKVTMAPFRTKSGKKIVYAVINITNTIKTDLDAANNKADFDAAYKKDYEAFSASAPIASLDNNNKDVIVMTGKPVTQDIKPNVSALNAPAVNNVVITVSRAAARVSVTATATEKAANTGVYEVKATLTGGQTKTFGEISNLKWSVAQYEKKFYLLQKDDRKSPNYDWTPNHNYTTEAPKRYDYTQLKGDKFFDIKHVDSYGLPQVASIKYKYISETTHANATDPSDPKTSGYRKGNTTYVLIKGKFTPADDMWAPGEKVLMAPDGDLFYGLATQKFYSSELKAKNAGNAANKIVTYKKGMVFYFLWVNPNIVDMTKWSMSPVYRNNIYNVDIKSFQNIGLSGNPFNPDDPSDPDKPDPDDPDTPDPDEPLPTEKTFMVATITITPWTWHNYSIDL
jgi:53kDa major outer membrane protein